MVLQSNENKYTLQFIAVILERLIKEKKINENDLYVMTEKEIIEIIMQSKYHNAWKTFNKTEYIERKEYLTEVEKNTYFWVSTVTKRREVNPLVCEQGKVARLLNVSIESINKAKIYQEFEDSKYCYVKKIKNF